MFRLFKLFRRFVIECCGKVLLLAVSMRRERSTWVQNIGGTSRWNSSLEWKTWTVRKSGTMSSLSSSFRHTGTRKMRKVEFSKSRQTNEWFYVTVKYMWESSTLGEGKNVTEKAPTALLPLSEMWVCEKCVVMNVAFFITECPLTCERKTSRITFWGSSW